MEQSNIDTKKRTFFSRIKNANVRILFKDDYKHLEGLGKKVSYLCTHPEDNVLIRIYGPCFYKGICIDEKSIEERKSHMHLWEVSDPRDSDRTCGHLSNIYGFVEDKGSSLYCRAYYGHKI